ncbi:MAG: orotate phosphoribosyltransferase [Gemmataceae bacterium]
MDSSRRQRLLDLVRTRAFSFGDFTLASGKKSSYYVNSKKILFHSESIALLAEALYEQTKDLDIQAVGGLEVGAIPLATALVFEYHRQGQAMEGFFVRKQAKGHGSQERIDGVLPTGARVAILDDVLTTGGSAQQAVEEVERAGASVVAVVCIVDRLQGARELFEKRYLYRPLFTIRDLGIDPAAS